MKKILLLSSICMPLIFGIVIIGNLNLFSATYHGDGVGSVDTVTITVRDLHGGIVSTQTTHNLITNAGKDFISAQIGSTASSTNGANYIALTTDNISPAAGDTTLASEITTGGLARAQGVYAHTGGTNTYTISKTFTASTSFTGVDKAGLFTTPSVGMMFAESAFSSVNLVSGDTISITWTVTLT
ncbi:MAG: hypothetical protein ACYDAJ_06635 [Nitrosotalea sp.]